VGDARRTRWSRWARFRLGAREKLDNLISVINCICKDSTDPVPREQADRGRVGGRVTGAGWNVIKVLVGGDWRPAVCARREWAAAEAYGKECVMRLPDLQGEGGAYIRQHFFRQVPELAEMVEDLYGRATDEPAPRRNTIR